MKIDERCRVAEKLLVENRDDIDTEDGPSMEEILRGPFPGIQFRMGWGGIDTKWWWNGWLVTVSEEALLKLGDEDDSKIMVNAQEGAR